MKKTNDNTGSPHNCEQIPAENTAVKLAMKDKLLKIQSEDHQYDIYSNQFVPLTTKADLLDRIKIQGKFDKQFSGGAIAHLNIDTQISNKEQMKDLIKVSASKGCIYFAINYNLQKCENNHMTVGKKETCDCGALITDNYTRVVGYLVNTKSFTKIRRELDYPNRQFYNNITMQSNDCICTTDVQYSKSA